MQFGQNRRYRRGSGTYTVESEDVTSVPHTEDQEVLKVSSRSNPNSVAGAMAGVIRTSGAVEVQVVGAGALNQAVKALAIARGYVAPAGIDLVCVPTFADIEIDGESRTAIRLLVEDRQRRTPAAASAAVNGVAVHVDLVDEVSSAPVEPAVDGASH